MTTASSILFRVSKSSRSNLGWVYVRLVRAIFWTRIQIRMNYPNEESYEKA